MKLLNISDLHIRSSDPVHRMDDYPEAVLEKAEFIVNTANKHDAHITIAGDIFHSVTVKPVHLNRLIDIFDECKNKIITVPGQHDMEHHKEDLIHSPYYTLIKAGVIHDIYKSRFESIAGGGWGFNPSSYNTVDSDNILLIHYCVTPDDPPFFLKESATSAVNLLRNFTNISYIISGDYHNPHVRRYRKSLLINCGSVGRSNKDQIKHEPSCWLIDTNKPGKYKRIVIPHEPAEEVFSKAAFVEKEEEQELFTENIKEIADLLKDKSKKPDYENIVKALAIKSKITSSQKNLLKGILRKVR